MPKAKREEDLMYRKQMETGASGQTERKMRNEDMIKTRKRNRGDRTKEMAETGENVMKPQTKDRKRKIQRSSAEKCNAGLR